MTLAYESSQQHDYPARLPATENKLGCTCISVGHGSVAGDVEEANVAASVDLALGSVLRFFEFAEGMTTGADEVATAFAKAEAKRAGMLVETVDSSSHTNDTRTVLDVKCAVQRSRAGGVRFFPRMFASARSSKPAGVEQHVVSNSLTVGDFDLLRVVGKGAFGKVMLVRKRGKPDEGRIFAMKVLKKSVIAAKGQTEHTRSERSILCEIRHPYIVRLRYAFQSEEKLYLVTDYYNGGSLFYHLRKSRGFQEPRARFYAAELILALDHLHTNGVIYRSGLCVMLV